MSREHHVCPFMKKTCIGCSIYRGRHSGLFTDGSPAHSSSSRRSKEQEPDWIDSLHSFFRDASIIQGEDPDRDET